MNKNEKLNLIRQTGIIAILRAKSSEQLIAAAEAIRQGGVKVIEVTFTTPGAVRVIEEASRKYGDDVLFGAGRVLDPETARTAILAGAGFIVAPTLNVQVIELCNRYSIPVKPGRLGAAESLTAWEAGASMIKLFPACIGGPDFLKAILAPLPQVELVPVGGVELNNSAAFIRAGATALGIGSSLVNQKLLDSSDFPELTRRAAAFIGAVYKGRGKA